MIKKNAKSVQSEETGYTYLGPTFRGLIQYGTFYSGTRQSIEDYLSDAIKKYPKIRELIIPDSELARGRTVIKTPGTWLNKVFNDLVKQAGV
jgi:hypothetical protein